MSNSYYRLHDKDHFPYTAPLKHLDENKKKMISELRMMTKTYSPYNEVYRIHEFCDNDEFYYRNLSVTTWKMKDLEDLGKFVEEALVFRKDYDPANLDVIPLIKYLKKHKLEDLKAVYPFGFDKDSRPILYLNVKEITRIPRDKEGIDFLFDLVVLIVEDIYRQGHINMNMVLDASGVGISFCSFIHSVGRRFSNFGTYYCGSIHKAYLVNAGWAIRAVWKVVKLFMHKHSQKKFTISKDNSILSSVIDVKNIPKAFGGKNKMEFRMVDYLETLQKEKLEREKNRKEDSGEETSGEESSGEEE